jgi:hypothetical protein
MPGSFGGQRLYDAASAARHCARFGLPASPFLGLANSYTNAHGPRPGQAWLLMSRDGLDAVDLEAPQTLAFSGDDGEQLTVPAMSVVRARCVLPSADDAPGGVYLVEAKDRRHLLDNVPVNFGYNVRGPDGEHMPATLDGGEPWTWQAMWESLWSVSSALGAFPGMPEAPHGTPEHFPFWASTLADAMEQVLARLGWGLRYSPLADSFTLFKVGEDDAAWDALRLSLSGAPSRRLEDEGVLTAERGTRPAKVAVNFRWKDLPENGTPFWAVEVDDPDGQAGAVAGSAFSLYDDMLATGTHPGPPDNLAELTARAEARARSYYDELASYGDRFRAVYGGVVARAAALPGPQIAAVRWGDLGQGMRTEVLRWPPRPAWRPAELPPPAAEAPEPPEAESSCDLAKLSNIDCVLVSDGEEEIILAKAGGVWTSADLYEYPLGAGVFEFWFADGRFHLSLDGLELADCGNGCFRAGPLTGHTPQRALPDLACSGDTFDVCVSCRCCYPEGWYCVDNGGGCPGEPLYLMDADVCEQEPSICSGPYDSEAEALAACGPTPGEQTITCDEIPTTLPGAYTLTWSTAVGMDGHPAVISTCEMTYQAGLSTPVTGPLVWQGTMSEVAIPDNGPCAGCGPYDFLIQQRVSCVPGEIPGSFVLVYETRTSCDGGANWDAWGTMGASGSDTNNGWAVGDPGFGPGTGGGGCGDCCAIWWSNDAAP